MVKWETCNLDGAFEADKCAAGIDGLANVTVARSFNIQFSYLC